MNKVDWKPVFIDGELHPDLHVGDRVLIYEMPDKHFGGYKQSLIHIATLGEWPKSEIGDDNPYYWENDGQEDYRVTFGIEFSKYWAKLPEIPEGE